MASAPALVQPADLTAMRSASASSNLTASPHAPSPARLFVWAVWAVMTLVALSVVFSYGRNIPVAEDWNMVAPLAGEEPSLAKWIWAQNNEHRIPLPRVVLLAVLKLANGDFRAGMVLNVLTMSAVAAGMMLAARAIRGGRTRAVDAFFPILLLHLGHWPNLFWAWQFTFVLPFALTAALLVVLLLRPTLSTAGAAGLAGACAVALPLCGANGLLIVPLLAPWLLWLAVVNWRGRGALGNDTAELRRERRITAGILFVSALLAVILCGVYFIGYVKPSSNTPSPSIVASIKTGLKCLGYFVGPIAAEAWKPAGLVALAVVVSTGLLASRAILRERGVERTRAIGLLLYLAVTVLLVMVVGHGRAGMTKEFGLPLRYVLFTVPVACAAFFIWQLYGPDRLRPAFLHTLLVGALLLLPANTRAGWVEWGDWYDDLMDEIETDLERGVTAKEFSDHHRKALIRWWPEKRFLWHLHMLKADRTGPFVQLRESSATTRPATQQLD